jgi:hypothetical protein
MLHRAEEQATEASRAGFGDDDFGVSHWVTLNRMRRRAGLNIYQAYAERAVPLAAGAARHFWTMVQAHPAEDRRGGTLARAMLQAMAPDLAALPICSGAQISGSLSLPLQLRVAAGEALKRHPRLARLIGRDRALHPSRFLDAPMLYETRHPWLDPDRLARLRGSSDMQAKILLWHFVAAQRLNAGSLFHEVLT